MTIASVSVYDAKPLQRTDGSLDVERLTAHLRSRLGYVACLRRRLRKVPGFGNPVWVEEPTLDLDRHLRHIGVPQPGDDPEVQRAAAWILTQPLARRRPLWDLWLLEGLRDDRFALVMRMHHSLVDGGSGLELMKAMHAIAPEAAAGRESGLAGAREVGRPSQSRRDLFAGLFVEEVRYRLSAGTQAVGDALAILTHPTAAFDQASQLARGLWSAAARPAPHTSLNRRVGRERSVSWTRSQLGELKAIKQVLGGTVNDVVLTVCAGVLREYFIARGEKVEGLTLRAACPADRRKRDGAGQEGNHTASLVVDLPLSIEHPLERHAAIVRATRDAKESGQSEATGLALELATRLAPGVATRIMKLASHFQNLVVSNVAGPPIPLYLMDCQLQGVFPLTVLLERTGLGITVFSYDGFMAWTFSADSRLVPRVDLLPYMTRQQLDALRGAANGRAPEAAGG